MESKTLTIPLWNDLDLGMNLTLLTHDLDLRQVIPKCALSMRSPSPLLNNLHIEN